MLSPEEREEKIKVAQSLKTFGGSFHSTLGQLLDRADEHNTRRIKESFSDDWTKYLHMHEYIQVPK